MAVTIDDIYLRDGGVCGICGEPVKLKQASVDHIMPRSKGGKDCMHNTQTTHWDCNRRKRAKMPDTVPPPCDCPEAVFVPVAEAETPARPASRIRVSAPVDAEPAGDSGAVYPDSPKTLNIRVGLLAEKVDESHAGAWELTFPDGRIWMFEMTTKELNRLLAEISSVHAYVSVKMLERGFASIDE